MNLRFILIISTLWIPMFGFGKSKKEISVEFIEQGTDEVFASSMMPTDQLPGHFTLSLSAFL